MRLLAIRLQHWGPWDHCEVTLGPRVNVLYGPNGAGKSTLVGALDRGLFDSHRGRGAALRALVPWGTSLAPRVELDLEVGDCRYRISKQFLVDASAILDQWRGGRWSIVAEGRDAEAKLRGLLGDQTGVGRRGGGRGAADVLWALQGRVDLPKTLDPTVERSLRESAGHLLEPPEARRIAERLKRRYAETFKVNGEPRKNTRLRELRDRAASLFEARAALDERLAASESQQARLSELVEQLELVEQRQAARRAELTEAKIALDRAAGGAQLIREAELAREAARGREAELARRVESVDRLRARVAALEAEVETGGARQVVLAREEGECAREVERLAALLADLRARWKAVRAAQMALAQRDERARLAAERAALDGRLERARELDRWLDSARKERAAVQPPPAAELQRLEQLERAVAARPAGGASGELEVEAARDLELLISDAEGARRQTLAEGERLRLQPPADGPLVVEVEGVGTVSLRASGGVAGGGASSPAAGERARLLEQLGGRSVDALRAAAVAARELDGRIGVLEAELRGVCGGAGTGQLQARAAQLDAALARLPEGGPVEVPGLENPDAETVEAALAEAVSEGQRVETEHRGQVERLAALRAERAQLGPALEAARTRLSEARAELAPLTSDGMTDDARRYAHAEAAEALGRRTEAWEALQRAHGDVAALPGRIAQLTDEIEREDGALGLRRTEAERLRGALMELRRGALAEEAEAVNAELADVERQLEREELRAAGLRMLYEYYVEERQRGLADLVGPVADRVRRDLVALGLPVERLALDDQLRPASVSLDARADVAPERLSYGERTQLVALLRLNLAELLGAKAPQLVVLDDQLVHSDARRSRALLARVSALPETVQVLAVTCHPAVYESLPEARWIDVSAAGVTHGGAPEPLPRG